MDRELAALRTLEVGAFAARAGAAWLHAPRARLLYNRVRGEKAERCRDELAGRHCLRSALPGTPRARGARRHLCRADVGKQAADFVRFSLPCWSWQAACERVPACLPHFRVAGRKRAQGAGVRGATSGTHVEPRLCRPACGVQKPAAAARPQMGGRTVTEGRARAGSGAPHPRRHSSQRSLRPQRSSGADRGRESADTVRAPLRQVS